MNWLARLQEAGFRLVGQWSLVGGTPVCRLSSHGSSSDVLYAFVIDGDVMYVGKTTMPLSRRMYGYQNPGPSQRTNVANNGLTHHGFRISLAAGLEDDIIRQVKPPWNKSGS